MNVRDLGEFGLIERLVGRQSVPSAGELIVGPGDDAAVWRAGDAFVMATTDTMVAGTHFLPERVPWRDVGWKALAANVSDIAAMGGTPTFALVTFCLPPEMPVAPIDELHEGLLECAAAHGVTIAGGDIVAAPVFTITVALCGEAMRGDDGQPRLLRRDAARAGDAIAVTGPLGGSGGGLRALLEGAAPGPVRDALVRRHMRPTPRIDAGRAAVDAGVRCGIDISDGLVQDLGHVCRASGVAAELQFESIPLDTSLIDAFPQDARRIAATAGEDYELLLVAPPDVFARAGALLGAPLVIVGSIAEGAPGVRVHDAGGGEVALDHAGWDHLKPA
ncbi:MAG TPA: thiamine-phosphate kinase [Dehalococcoidia bacterium]|nr:thiamine-phosphate kinase [Dehalococcoidia bacterium]